MNVLDSHLEALAFNYLSFGFFSFVNNLWTWIAVVTAAVSFWRIRSYGDSSRCLSPLQPQSRDDLRSSNGAPPPCTADEAAEQVRPASSQAPATAPAKSVEEIGVTKGRKFVLFYDDVNGESTEKSDGELTGAAEEEKEESDDGEAVEEWWEGWERVLRTRTGRTGWYRYQDLTELNGNVVRLWDVDIDDSSRSKDTNCCCGGPKRCVLW